MKNITHEEHKILLGEIEKAAGQRQVLIIDGYVSEYRGVKYNVVDKKTNLHLGNLA